MVLKRGSRSTVMNNIPKEVWEKLVAAIDSDGDLELDRRQLYERGLAEYPHLPRLAMEWVQELANEKSVLPQELWWSGRRPGEEARTGLPPRVYHEDTLEMPPLDEVYRIRVDDSQTLLMWRSRERTPEGYKNMVIRDEFFRSDMAILAVLTTMEADRAEPKEALWMYAGDEPELDFAEALLRYYRDSFDSLSPDVQKDLKIETFSKIYDFLEALRLLMAYLEYGEPRKGVKRKPLTTFRRDVRAAELKHIEGLKNHEIVERLEVEGLGFDEPKEYRDEAEKKEKYARKARDSAKRGKEQYLEKALCEKKLRQHFSRAKAEMKHFENLDDVDRLMWTLADRSDYVRLNVVKNIAPGDINRDKRDKLRGVLSRLLQGDGSVLESMNETLRPTHHADEPPRGEE